MNRAASAGRRRIALFYCLASSFLIASCDATIHDRMDDRPLADDAEQAPQATDHTAKDLGESLEEYVDNDLYLVLDLDIDMDGKPDKVVSSAQNSGNKLIFFRCLDGECHSVLTSTNLTEDGGRVLGYIKQERGATEGDEVISIETFFPKGTDIATHYISYSNGAWMLSRTVYEVSDWRNRENLVHRCEVEQNIPMQELSSEEVMSRVRQLPDESARDELCVPGMPSDT
jgi:hypothetical protein